MSLTRQEVEQIAHLARLELTEQQVETYRQQLSEILAAVDALSALDLTDVPPTTHAIPMVNRLRDDKAAAALPRDAVLANAPQATDDQFVIQAVLDE